MIRWNSKHPCVCTTTAALYLFTLSAQDRLAAQNQWMRPPIAQTSHATAAPFSLPRLAATPLAADNSANATVSGFYFIRQVLLSDFTSTGQAGRARSVVGLATFDGKGAFTFAGVIMDTKAGTKQQNYNASGTYSVGANGLFQMTNPIDNLDTDFGGVGAAGPSAFTASATEGGYDDILVGVPILGIGSLASVSGTYRTGYIDYLQGDLTKVRQGSFNLTPNGLGSVGSITVSGSGANLGNVNMSQNVSSVSYSVDPNTGIGTLNFGALSSSQLISGSKAFVISTDKSMILGCDPGGFDLMVGVRPYTGSNANASYTGPYYYAQLADDASGLPSASVLNSNYGSILALGNGAAIIHQRYIESDLSVAYDFTYDSQNNFDATGTIFQAGSPEFLGAGGQTLVAVGGGNYFTLLVGLQGKPFTGPSVFLYPTAVVNAASYAPITNPIAPGEYVTLFGSGLAPGTFPQAGQPLTLPFPTTLGGVKVTINGKNAPLYYVSPGQISLIVPDFGSTTYVPTATATVQVSNNGTLSNPVTLRLYGGAPGVLTAGSNGISTALVQRSPDYALVSTSNPIKPGDTIVIYCTGLGPVFPKVADGQAAPSNPLSKVTNKVLVYIDDQPATVLFAGLTPGFVSLYQINATVPNGISRGKTVSLGIGLNEGTFGFPIAYTAEAKLPTAQ